MRRSAAPVTSVHPVVVIASAALVDRGVGVGMADSVRAEPFHDPRVAAAVQRPRPHVVIRRGMDHAREVAPSAS